MPDTESKLSGPPRTNRERGPEEFSEDVKKNFWAMVDIRGPKDCWLFKGVKNKPKEGYGQYNVRSHGGKKYLAHRLAWILTYGPVPEGKQVHHNCPDGDNPACCNPEHLWVGDQKQNLQDCIEKGRFQTGDRHWMRRMPEKVRRGNILHNTTIPDEQIPEVFAMRKQGMYQRQIAKHFGVKTPAICRILSGKRRSHLHPSIFKDVL